MINRPVEVYQRITIADGEKPRGLRYKGTLLEIIKDVDGELLGIVMTPEGYLEDVFISLLRITD